MSVITIRLPEKLLSKLDESAHIMHIRRAEYIRFAIEHLNKEVKNKIRKEKLKKISLRVRKKSMRVNKEFGRIEYDPED